jgi:DNA-binding response OmpR family regulator
VDERSARRAEQLFLPAVLDTGADNYLTKPFALTSRDRSSGR